MIAEYDSNQIIIGSIGQEMISQFDTISNNATCTPSKNKQMYFPGMEPAEKTEVFYVYCPNDVVY